MATSIHIRKMVGEDLIPAKQIIADNDMFPPDLLDGMWRGHQTEVSEQLGLAEEQWFVIENVSGHVAGLAYCAPEMMTEGTWNLLLIAVSPKHHGQGLGSALIERVEHSLRKIDARVLLVETSGLPDFQRTRAFYPKCGYVQVAVIPEFYAPGDDKVVFWKRL